MLFSRECRFKPTSCEPSLLDLMPTSDRAGVYNIDTLSGDINGPTHKSSKIGMLADSAVVEAVVGIR